MKKITKISDVLEKRAFESSIEFFWIINNGWKVTTDISTKEYKSLIHNIYKIHEKNNNIYDFQNDIKKYLYSSLLMAINDNSNVINKEKLLDGIFEVEIKKRCKTDINNDRRRSSNGRKCH